MVAFDSSAPNIVVENVQVRYTVGTKDPGSRSQGIQRLSDLAFGRRGTITVRALRGINLIAREGEMVGVVGANGSGKSTLLRNIAGVEQPDRGRILARYQPVLLGVNAALQPALSGSENVRLGCLAMGLTPEEAASAFESVVELSALGTAIHRPMGTYSSGMGARLRFAIALAVRPKILLIDEALSTGDATFGERSERAMSDLLEEAGTVLLVNHAAKVIQELCTRAVWMHKGEILMDGPAEPVAEKYRWWAWNVAKGKEDVADKLLHDVVRNATKDDINVLDPELIKNPVPRHAVRHRVKRKPSARHARGDRGDGYIEEFESSQLVGAGSQVWNESPEPERGGASFPKFPSVASEGASSSNRIADFRPLQLRPSGSRVILRAADPLDRASSVAYSKDLTGRRLASQARQIKGRSSADSGGASGNHDGTAGSIGDQSYERGNAGDLHDRRSGT